MDDIDEEKLPEKVKLSIASSGFEKLAINKREMEHEQEKDRGLDLLQQVLPEANLNVKKKKIVEFQPVARFNPDSTFVSTLVAKKPEKPKQPIKMKGKDLKPGDLKIKKGMDKAEINKKKADEILKKTTEAYLKNSNSEKGREMKRKEKQVKIIKEVKKENWNEIKEKAGELKEFKLFG